MSISFGDRVHILTKDPQLAYLDNHLATITHSDRRGYYLQVDGMKPAVHLSNLQGMQCLNKLTSAQESVLGLPSQVYDPDLGWQDLPKSIPSAPKYSNSDTPESPTMVTSNNSRKRGRPRKESTSLPPALPVNPSLTKETASAKTTPEIVYPTSEKSLNKLTPHTGRSRTSPAYSASTAGNTSENSSNGLTSAGMTVNGSLLAQDTLEAPILENDSLFLESPGALGEGILGNNPPGQTKLEGQLKQNGSIAIGEVSNPEFLEASLGLPIGWTDPQDDRTATELDQAIALSENAVKPLEISLTPELPNSQSIGSSTMPKQLDLTSKVRWVDLDQLEEVSYTQIRHSIDNEAIARYAELMRDNLWDFNREPLPVLFEHENRYLIGDGHHRIEAARKHKLKIKCEIFTAWSIEDALLYSIRAVENSSHGIPLRPKDQRKRITMFLDLLESEKVSIVPPEGYQEWSARAIAAYLKLPESGYRTVATIRRERLREAIEEETPPAIDTTNDDTTNDDTTEATTPPPFSKGEATPTIVPVKITTPPPTNTPVETSAPTLGNLEEWEAGMLGRVERDSLKSISLLGKCDSHRLEGLAYAVQALKDAIEAEETRRLGKILEEEKGSN